MRARNTVSIVFLALFLFLRLAQGQAENPIQTALDQRDYLNCVSQLHALSEGESNQVLAFLASHPELPPLFLYEYANRQPIATQGITWWVIADIRCHYDILRLVPDYDKNFDRIRDKSVPMSPEIKAAWALDHQAALAQAKIWCLTHPGALKTDPSWVMDVSKMSGNPLNAHNAKTIWTLAMSRYFVNSLPIHVQAANSGIMPKKKEIHLATQEGSLLLSPTQWAGSRKLIVIGLSIFLWMLVYELLPKQWRLAKVGIVALFIASWVVLAYLNVPHK